MNLIYLHGFNSDGGGFKYDRLRKKFKQASVYSPDLPPHPLQLVAQVDQLIQSLEGPTYCIGTSLGGFYAYYFSAKYQQPCFLFNPSLQPHRTLHRGIGYWETFQKQRPYEFKAEYLPLLQKLKEEAASKTSPTLLNFFLATDDDILDLSFIPDAFPNANTLLWFENAGHSFSKFPQAFPRIAEVLGIS